MSAEVTLALVGVTVAVLVLLTYAAFRYVPMVLEETEGSAGTEPAETPELPGGNFPG